MRLSQIQHSGKLRRIATSFVLSNESSTRFEWDSDSSKASSWSDSCSTSKIAENSVINSYECLSHQTVKT